jgi:peptidoglycan/xylan/chitin deacetylase (PgdA/CDA1 family)
VIATSAFRRRRRFAVACLLAASAAAGCSSGGGDEWPRKTGADAPPAETGRDEHAKAVPAKPGKAAEDAARRAADEARQAAAAEAARAEAERAARTAREAASRRWGLASPPLAAPAPPAKKPVLTDNSPHVVVRPGLPPVVRRVPTTDKVVFLTIDDGAEKDPDFSRMLRELGVPVSAFVSDYLARSDYGYFRDLRDHGVTINNHTLNHKDLRRLDAAGQRSEVCGQQDSLTKEMGERPKLFRPPYGEYTAETLAIAGSCGVTAVPLWNEEAFPDRIEYRYGDHKLQPGDIILTHFRGADTWAGGMPDMLRRVLREVTSQGFALARLEDYL